MFGSMYSLHITEVSLCNGSHTSQVTGESLLRLFSIPRNDYSSFFIFSDGMSVTAWILFVSGLTPSYDIIFPKKRMLIHLNRHLFLLSFRFACWNIHSKFSSISPWFLLHSSKSTINMSSAILKIFGKPQNNSSTVFWKISPTGTPLNGSLMYLYLPNGHENDVRYNDLSSSFKL